MTTVWWVFGNSPAVFKTQIKTWGIYWNSGIRNHIGQYCAILRLKESSSQKKSGNGPGASNAKSKEWKRDEEPFQLKNFSPPLNSPEHRGKNIKHDISVKKKFQLFKTYAVRSNHTQNTQNVPYTSWRKLTPVTQDLYPSHMTLRVVQDWNQNEWNIVAAPCAIYRIELHNVAISRRSGYYKYCRILRGVIHKPPPRQHGTSALLQCPDIFLKNMTHGTTHSKEMRNVHKPSTWSFLTTGPRVWEKVKTLLSCSTRLHYFHWVGIFGLNSKLASEQAWHNPRSYLQADSRGKQIWPRSEITTGKNKSEGIHT